MPSVHEWTGVLLWMEIISKMVLKLSARTGESSLFQKHLCMCGHCLDGAPQEATEDNMKLFSQAERSSYMTFNYHLKWVE